MEDIKVIRIEVVFTAPLIVQHENSPRATGQGSLALNLGRLNLRPRGRRGLCEDCGELGYKNKGGYKPKFWPDKDVCDGLDENGRQMRHPRP